MKKPLPFFRPLLALLLAVLIGGCFSHQEVRHLASDVCLVTPMRSTKKDVLVYMGQPRQRRKLGGGKEEWVYYEVHKSTLRKTPYIGEKLGTEEYDLAVVGFSGETVTDVSYRLLTEKDFKKLALPGTDDREQE